MPSVGWTGYGPYRRWLRRSKRTAALVLNKIDLVKREDLLALAAEFNAAEIFDETFMISALKGDGVADILSH